MSACGGGGGGSEGGSSAGNGGGSPSGGGGTGNTPATHTLGASVIGLNGTLGLNVNGQVSTIAANGSANLATLSTGMTYSVAIASQPTGQTCSLENGSGTITANTAVTVSCTNLIEATKSSFAAAELATFTVAGVTLDQESYSGAIDGNIPVTFAAVDGKLATVLPPLDDGEHTFEVSIGGVTYPLSVTVSSPALSKPAAQINTEQFDALDAKLVGILTNASAEDRPAYEAARLQLQALRTQVSAASTAEQEFIARFLLANDPSTTPAFGRSPSSRSFQKWTDPECDQLRESARLTAEGLLASIGTFYVMIGAGWTGPAGFIVSTAAMVAIIELKFLPAAQEFALWRINTETHDCLSFRDVEFTSEPDEWSSYEKLSMISSYKPQDVLTFNHKVPRNYSLVGRGSLPDELHATVRFASLAVQYLSARLPNSVVAALQNWTIDYTRALDPANYALGTISDQRITGSLVPNGEKIQARFLFMPEQMPSAPVDFTFMLTRGDESWSIPARLNIIDAPISYSGSLTTRPDEPVSSQLLAEFADSYRISLLPTHGSVLLDATTGVFTYTPHTGYEGSDSFTFVATNERGDSAPSVIEIDVNDHCGVYDGGSMVQYVCYSDGTFTEVTYEEQLTYSAGSANPIDILVTQYRRIVPGDPSSVETVSTHRFALRDSGATVLDGRWRYTWTTMPEAPYYRILEERAGSNYVDATNQTFVRESTQRNYVTMTASRVATQCYGSLGFYQRQTYTIAIDNLGTLAPWEVADSPRQYLPCPFSPSDLDTIQPTIDPKETRVYKIWTSVPR